LASVAGQDVDGASVEVIVVNDGGMDVADTVRHRKDLGLDVRSVTLPRRLGLPTARNAGIESAGGDHIAFLDDDDVFLPHHLRTALKALDEDDADAVNTTCLDSPRRVDPATPVDAAPHSFGYAYQPDLLTVCNYIPCTASYSADCPAERASTRTSPPWRTGTCGCDWPESTASGYGTYPSRPWSTTGCPATPA
jgi:glycosyltransferase involved in cell wall biosynthesis